MLDTPSNTISDVRVQSFNITYEYPVVFTRDAFSSGNRSLIDVLAARRELSQAHFTQLDTRATVLQSTAALAFASGDLGPQLLNRNRKK